MVYNSSITSFLFFLIKKQGNPQIIVCSKRVLEMDRVGSDTFRRVCASEIAETGWYKNLGGFLQRYVAGEDFDYEKLKALGYNHFEARNLAAYINHSHNDNYYSNALGWE